MIHKLYKFLNFSRQNSFIDTFKISYILFIIFSTLPSPPRSSTHAQPTQLWVEFLFFFIYPLSSIIAAQILFALYIH